jgi:uncharacterized damage-inducible protein DinB
MKWELMDLFRLEHDHSWDQEAWFLPLAAALQGVSAAEAAWQPPGGGNTIWQTVNHLNYYNDRLVHQIKGSTPGDGLPSNTATFGEPGDPNDTDGWEATLKETHRINEELRQLFAPIKDEMLKEEYIKGLAFQIMHNVYHTGQIVQVRKQQGSWQQEREYS